MQRAAACSRVTSTCSCRERSPTLCATARSTASSTTGSLRMWASVLSSQPAITLGVESGGEVLACSHNTSKLGLRTMALREFPADPSSDGVPILTAAGIELSAPLERVGSFISSDETRPILCGINLDWSDGPVLAATDSYRVAAIAAPGELNARRRTATRRRPDPNRLTISGRAMLLAAKDMRRARTVRLLANDTHAMLQFEASRWTVPIVHGDYPHWRTWIPKALPHEIKVPVLELAEAWELAVRFAA